MKHIRKLEEVRKDLFREKFIRELKDLESEQTNDANKSDDKENSSENDINENNNENNNEDNNEERIKQLKHIINDIDSISFKNDIFDQMEKHMYKLPWKKLKPFHRMNKIREYFEDNKDKFKSKKLKKKMLSDLEKYIYKNKLASSKYVVYNNKTRKIESIPALVIDEENKKFEIKIK